LLVGPSDVNPGQLNEILGIRALLSAVIRLHGRRKANPHADNHHDTKENPGAPGNNPDDGPRLLVRRGSWRLLVRLGRWGHLVRARARSRDDDGACTTVMGHADDALLRARYTSRSRGRIDAAQDVAKVRPRGR